MESEQGRVGQEVQRTPLTRRGFIAGAAGGVALVALGAVKLAPNTPLVRPPGADGGDGFFGTCIRCAKCMEVCPNGVIVPAHIEDGIVSVRTPRLNFSIAEARLGGKLGWCDHCEQEADGTARCVEVCPSGALSEAFDKPFADMRLGVAVIERDWCLAWLLKGCAICKNACPRDAIVFDEHNRPIVVEDACNGCGACEQACVSLESVSLGEGSTTRAMTARAVTVHALES